MNGGERGAEWDGNRDATGIVAGQRVADEKVQLAWDLRRRMTPAETILWAALRGRRLGGLRFRRQQVVDGFIVDFYCDAAHLILEVDGEIHQDQQGHDAARDQILAGRGLRVIRLTNDEVLGDLRGALRRIETLARSGTPLT
jgi:very-short-patch-repair endonuclease